MAIIHQHDKRSGITYAYESHSYWDKEKRMTRAKRKLIGRVDSATGEIVATDGRCRKDKVKEEQGVDPDYKTMYEKLLKKHTAQESLVKALQKEIDALKGKGQPV
jgi:hypothetical protein